MKKIIKLNWLAVCFYSFLLSVIPLSTVLAYNSIIEVNSMDTIAGYSSALSSSITKSNTIIYFEVEKPDGSLIKIESKTDPAGIARSEVLGHHTKKTGLYKVRAYIPGNGSDYNYSTFKVYPDDVSDTKSEINSNLSSLEANDYETSFISVKLKDKYGNPIPDHMVTLISSRVEDKIEALSNKTDETGEIFFKVWSDTPGISTFIATDITSNTIVRERPEIVFYAPSSHSSPEGGDKKLLAEILEEEDNPLEFEEEPEPTKNEVWGEINHFEIIIDDKVSVNEEQSITVTAKDIDGNTVKDYTGEILFAVSTDENAILPENYKFTSEDQGEKIFSLAIKFTEIGVHEIEVLDNSDWDLNGIKEIKVIKQKTETPDTKDELVILSPKSGLKTGQTVLIISGKGPSNIPIKIFMDDSKIGVLDTDTKGKFEYTITNLKEGNHKIYVTEDNDTGGSKSNSIDIEIDISGANLDSFEITPEGPIETGTELAVKLFSEPNLEKASILVDSIEHTLDENLYQKGLYETKFIAPSKKGNYPINVQLIDQYQNEKNITNKHILQVIEKEIIYPPKVTGITSNSLDRKVKLEWDKIDQIKYYKVYYGEKKDSLNRTTNTPDNTASIEISNLKNDKEYFFAVTAINEEDLESEEKSLVIAETPKSKQVVLRAAPSDSQITLTWNKFQDISTSKYIVVYGLKSNTYSDSIVSNITSTVVPNLINNVEYYFRVYPTDSKGNIIKELSSKEVSAKPIVLGDKPLTNKTPTPLIEAQNPVHPIQGSEGTETNILILISLFIAVIIYKIRRSYI